MARGIEFDAREAYAVVEIRPNGTPVAGASGLYTYKRHANARRNEANSWGPNGGRGRFVTVPVVLIWHLEAAE